ncbi:HET-domain-containing protein [Xylariaceae sp. FL1651]|nr:HET-domain-containing protein [Xylariaceae sp. FL1651]
MGTPQLYRALNAERKGIRLLRLLPGAEGEPVEVLFQYASLLEPPFYETISYCWGDATVRDEIRIGDDGVIIDVPASSAAALRCMRRTEKPRIVWMDALCINQADLDERAQQVCLMADLYKCARNNLVYLGEEDEQARSGLETVERVYDEMRRETSNLDRFHGLIRKFLQRGKHADKPLGCKIDESALASIFGRPWFQRLWVIQEAVLARCNSCYCGRNLIFDLTMLLRVAIWLCYYRDSLSPWFWDFDGLHNAADMWSWVDDKGNSDSFNTDTFTNLLQLARYRLSTEPSDKVFAMLGMVHMQDEGKEQEFPPEHLLLTIDYKKPHHQVMRDATRYAIQEILNLVILQCVSHRIEDLELDPNGQPSWVARVDIPFDPDLDAESIPYTNFCADNYEGLYAEDVRSNTGGPDTLCLPGYDISSIVEVSDVFAPAKWESKTAVADLLKIILAMVNRISAEDIYWWAHGEQHDDSFSPNLTIALLAGTNIDSQDPTASEIEDFRSLLNKLVSRCLSPWDEDREELYKKLRDKCQNRRFFTGSGGHIGLVPRCARPGDRATILLGSSVPLVLRPVRGGAEGGEHRSMAFQFLGDAYVNGVMKGEYVSSAREADYEPQMFFLV